MIWFLLWLVFASVIFGIFFWTTRILWVQKRVWRDFATSHKLEYVRGPLMASARVSGMIADQRLNLFSDEQILENGRVKRFRTVVELSCDSNIQGRLAVGCGELGALIEGVDLPDTYTPHLPLWKPDWVVRGEGRALIKAYLTPERIKALHAVFNIPRISAVFVFDENQILLHVQTANPLHERKKLDALVRRMSHVLKEMRLSQDEVLTRNDPQSEPETKPQKETGSAEEPHIAPLPEKNSPKKTKKKSRSAEKDSLESL